MIINSLSSGQVLQPKEFQKTCSVQNFCISEFHVRIVDPYLHIFLPRQTEHQQGDAGSLAVRRI